MNFAKAKMLILLLGVTGFVSLIQGANGVQLTGSRGAQQQYVEYALNQQREAGAGSTTQVQWGKDRDDDGAKDWDNGPVKGGDGPIKGGDKPDTKPPVKSPPIVPPTKPTPPKDRDSDNESKRSRDRKSSRKSECSDDDWSHKDSDDGWGHGKKDRFPKKKWDDDSDDDCDDDDWDRRSRGGKGHDDDWKKKGDGKRGRSHDDWDNGHKKGGDRGDEWKGKKDDRSRDDWNVDFHKKGGDRDRRDDWGDERSHDDNDWNDHKSHDSHDRRSRSHQRRRWHRHDHSCDSREEATVENKNFNFRTCGDETTTRLRYPSISDYREDADREGGRFPCIRKCFIEEEIIPVKFSDAKKDLPK
ncbi:hypothetical protein FGO68_gene17281 [Halteria grandinella]|uniref:Uncharacterized protein n=1 Tax=Halteria grandinella TaxID=5974 RepID=A0A8J8NRG4_HALGN|nr:hypothetical protein FGO68_gene17281 [Halteria grandinella]